MGQNFHGIAENGQLLKSRTEWNEMECSLSFGLLTRSFDLGLGIPKLKFLGF